MGQPNVQRLVRAWCLKKSNRGGSQANGPHSAGCLQAVFRIWDLSLRTTGSSVHASSSGTSILKHPSAPSVENGLEGTKINAGRLPVVQYRHIDTVLARTRLVAIGSGKKRQTDETLGQ